MRRARMIAAVAVAALALPAASAQKPSEPFVEQLEVREMSVAVVPPGAGEPPPLAEVTVTVEGLGQRVTRVERLREGEQGEWRFVVYLDPQLAGARTRFLSSLALGQRAEELAALGTVEVLVAGAERPALERTGSWQRIEAALFERALAAKRRLASGEPVLERPDWPRFRERLELLLAALEGRGAGGPRALLVPADGVDSAPDSAAVAAIARALAGTGWIMVPMPWSELPAEGSAARLSEFERWKEGVEGRDVSAGQRRYVIDFGRVARRLRGVAESPPPAKHELEPRLAALHQLAEPTSGRPVAGDGELRAVLSNLARRWQVWFQLREPGDGGLRPLAVQLGDRPLEAPRWILSPKPGQAAVTPAEPPPTG